MDHQRDTEGLMSAPESELLHEVVRLREQLRAAEARANVLELELAHARGKLRAYESLAPSTPPWEPGDLADMLERTRRPVKLRAV